MSEESASKSAASIAARDELSLKAAVSSVVIEVREAAKALPDVPTAAFLFFTAVFSEDVSASVRREAF